MTAVSELLCLIAPGHLEAVTTTPEIKHKSMTELTVMTVFIHPRLFLDGSHTRREPNLLWFPISAISYMSPNSVAFGPAWTGFRGV